MMGLIGWSVAVPTLLGAALGLWLDQHHPGKHSWTLALLVAGLAARLFQRVALGRQGRQGDAGRTGGKTMNESLSLALALAAGLLLGAIFFGGLWWTVRGRFVPTAGAVVPRQPAAAHERGPGGFYFVSGGDWERLLLCLLGFVLARLVVNVADPPARRTQQARVPETSHAP